MRRRYSRDSVTGKLYDPVTKQFIHEALADTESVSGDEVTRESAPAPARKESMRQAPTLDYTPPAGFSADPREFLQQLLALDFTTEQVAYLRGPAHTQYTGALATARGDPNLATAVALGDEILAAWDAALSYINALQPSLFHNPFNE